MPAASPLALPAPRALPEWFLLHEAAEHAYAYSGAEIPGRTIVRLAQLGHVRTLKLPRARTRYSRSDIERLLTRNTSQLQPDLDVAAAS